MCANTERERDSDASAHPNADVDQISAVVKVVQELVT